MGGLCSKSVRSPKQQAPDRSWANTAQGPGVGNASPSARSSSPTPSMLPSPLRQSASDEADALPPRVVLGTSPSTLQRRLGAPMQPHEMQQLAYLVAAMLIGDPVSSPDRFVAAGQTLHDVRVLLKHGRGNIYEDRAASEGRNVAGSFVAYGGLNLDNTMALAGALGTGYCDHFARLSSVSHAPHLRESDVVATPGGTISIREQGHDGTVSVVRAGHSWTEIRAAERDRSGDSTIVQDGWSNGPAVRLKDSAWSNVDVTQEDMMLDKDTALWRKSRVERLIPLVHPAEDENTAKRLAMAMRRPTSPDRFLETQVVSQDFAANARDALERVPLSYQADLVAMLAQQVYRQPPERAHDPHFIHEVLQQVGALDRQDRPPIVPPDR